MLINYNGALVESSHPVLNHSSRLARYGDGVFESMAMFDEKIKLLDLHSQRLASGARTLEMIFPPKLEGNGIYHEIEKLRQANDIIHGRVRMMLFRDSGGFYAPEANNASFIIETEHVKNNKFEFNTGGLNIGIYNEIKKPVNILSNIKTCNALLYVKAGLYRNKNAFDECLILNTNNNICESISSNIFWIKNGIVYTPSPDSGCILGVMRNHLLRVLKDNNISFVEGEFDLNAAVIADEVFLTGATKGIVWVKKINNGEMAFTFHNEMTEKIFSLI